MAEDFRVIVSAMGAPSISRGPDGRLFVDYSRVVAAYRLGRGPWLPAEVPSNG